MTTLKEIAAMAGVSRGTIDRVLNNRGAVKPETEKRVRDIIRALDYHPNKAALTLAAQKKKITIGVLLFGEQSQNLFFQDVLEGVEFQQEKLVDYGCTILIERCDFETQSQLVKIDELLSAGIHGLVISPYNAPEIRQKINLLYELGIPCITTNTDISDSKRIAYVGSNYYESGKTAGGLMGLITHGNARVGIVTGSPLVLCHTERIAGFLDVIHKDYPGIEDLDTLVNLDNDLESYKSTTKLIKRYPDINALFFAAAGVYGGCQAVIEHGKSKQIHIISFDSVETTKQMVRDGIIAATICQQPFYQGSRPVELMFEYLTTGVYPSEIFQYTETSIKIKENV